MGLKSIIRSHVFIVIIQSFEMKIVRSDDSLQRYRGMIDTKIKIPTRGDASRHREWAITSDALDHTSSNNPTFTLEYSRLLYKSDILCNIGWDQGVFKSHSKE